MKGKGIVIIKLTLEKQLVFLDVLHVPDNRKNLVSSPILVNKGFKIVFEYAKVVLTKGEQYVGKGYLDMGSSN